MRVREANTQKARVSPAKLRKTADVDVVFKDLWLTASHRQLRKRTEIISALEMLGAMLLMNREQVLCSGRGLGESSLVFFSSFFSTSVLFLGFSSSSSMKQ